MKRRIAIKKISGITKSKDAKSLEFVLHVPEEYDYRFAANRRDIIINYIKKIFLFHQKANLPIFGVHVSNLKDFTQTRVEKMARMPGEKVGSTINPNRTASGRKTSSRKRAPPNTPRPPRSPPPAPPSSSKTPKSTTPTTSAEAPGATPSSPEVERTSASTISISSE